MKIGIFAGTFDPVHNGHIAFAEVAIKKAGLDRVIIIAEKEPYRKKPYATWDHRQAMIERATEDVESVDHDYRFAAEAAKQHTLTNLLALAAKHYGPENEFWFLVGSDVLEHLHRWEDVADSKQYGGFIIALRHDHTQDWVKTMLEKAKQSGHELGAVIIESPVRDLGSTTIRKQIAAHEATPDLPAKTATYIKEHDLYTDRGTLRET